MTNQELLDLLSGLGFGTPKQRSDFINAVREITGWDLATGPVSQTDAAAKTPKVEDSGFSFGAASLREMQGVDGTLVRVATLALKYSLQDFCVYDGIRTRMEQAEHVRLGTSKTMESKHLDGLALDLVPWINGKPVWDWDGCINVALAMIRAAHELKVAHRITWGGLWDRKLSDLDWRTVDLPKELADYRARHAGPDFLDGPHFEITRS